MPSSGARFVPDVGRRDARIVVVGEAPGRHENEQGKPFVGPAGWRLDEWLAQAGLRRDDCYITNCLEKSTRVLMASLEWRAIGDVQVGDRLLAFDEHGKTRGPQLRKWRISEVLATTAQRRECVRLRTEDGRQLIATKDHMVLVGVKGRRATVHWRLVGDMRVGPRHSTAIASAIKPWPARSRYEFQRGYLAGLLDGEGHISAHSAVKSKRSFIVAFTQRPNVVLETGKELLRLFEFDVGLTGPHHGVFKAWVRGGVEAGIGLLGVVRPPRLLQRFSEIMQDPPVIRLRPTPVVEKVPVGECDVVDITTTTGTFIAEGFAVHNCYPYQPVGNKLNTVPQAERVAWIDALHQRLAALDAPFVVVPTGDTALKALTGRANGILKNRGFIAAYTDQRGRAIKCIPTIHPAATFRTPTWIRRCLLDWRRVAAEAQFAEHRLPTWEHVVNPTLSDIAAFTADVRQRAEMLSVDIETFGGEMSCVGFAYTDTMSLTIPTLRREWPSDAAHAAALASIRALCALPVPKALQYGFYDYYWLADVGIVPVAWEWDCAALYHCLTGDTRVLFADLVWRRLDEVKVGDVLASFDEEAQRGHRKLRQSRVTKTGSRFARVHEVSFSNGEVVCGTGDHRFLVGRWERHGRRSGSEWRELRNLRVGDEVWSIGRPWTIRSDYDAGWLAGIFDGEGSASPKLRVAVAQKPGEVLDRAKALLDAAGFVYNEFASARAHSVSINGGLGDALRLLGQLRPLRLLARVRAALNLGVGDALRFRGTARVTGIRPVGWRKVYDVSTTTRTFLANGVLVHNCIDAADDHALDYMASIELRMPPWKHIPKDAEARLAFPSDAAAIYAYNGIDCIVQRILAERFATRLGPRLPFYFQHYRDLFLPLLTMMRHGVATDGEARRTLGAEMRTGCEEAQHQLQKVTGVDLRGARNKKRETAGKLRDLSNVKLMKLFYDQWHFPAPMKRRANGASTRTIDEVAVRKIMVQLERDPAMPRRDVWETCRLVLDHRRKKKTGEFMAENRVDADGRMRSSYSFAPETGRLASSKNPRGTGSNAQNVMRAVRRVFVPDPRCIFLEVDTSQGEDRMVKAMVASLLPEGPRREELLWRARAQPWENDEHLRAAAVIFRQPLDKVTRAYGGGDEEAKKQRYFGKKSRHASNYGEGGKHLSEDILKEGVVITSEEGDRMIQAVLDHDVPEVRDWQRKIREIIMQERKLVNGWGRELLFEYDRLDDDTYRRGYAFLPQSSLPAIVNQYGFRPLWEAIRAGAIEAAVNVNGHDSLLISVPPRVETVWTLWQFLKRSLERPRTYWGVELTIPVELKLGLNWSFAPGRAFKRPPSRDEIADTLDALLKEAPHVCASPALPASSR